TVVLTEASADRALRSVVATSACARFSTVLGPGSDSSHQDHIHLDLIERRSGFRICQWNVQ
ncbi:MAG TPA: extensin family protein, partial [Rhodoplanes sp.]|nr:extensin family protein [Rhodoplanes sp.]